MSDQVKIPLPRSLQEIVGSLLFASQDPLTAAEIRDAVKSVEPEEGENAEVMDVYKTCTNREIGEALKGLEKALDVAGCGFKLVCTGGTYRMQTTPSCGRYVRALLKLDRPNRIGRASLETLAIIAYRQPITKSEIEEIRGVDVSGNIKTLVDLQLVRLVGKSELPGHPFLYGTTPLFLEHFGLANLQQLNELDPTLQRSNPRLKAASYKKAEKTELEKAAQAESEKTAEEIPAEVTEEASVGEDEDKTKEVSSSAGNGELFVVENDDDFEDEDGFEEDEDEEDEFDDDDDDDEDEDEFDDEEDEDEEDEFDEDDDDEDEEDEDEEDN
jgi:segregation and condensation protein B